MCNVVYRTAFIGDDEIFQARMIKDGVQYRHSIRILCLQYAGFACFDALLHRIDAGSKAANSSCCGRNSTAAQLQFRAGLYRSRQQQPRDSERRIIPAERLKIAIHNPIGRGCGREMRKTQRIQINRRVDNATQRKDVRRLGKD